MAGKKGMKRRTKAQIEAVREAAREYLAAHHPATLRQVHYRLTSRDDIVHPNTQNAYNTLGGWLRDDRLDGTIPWEWMDDRLRKATKWAMWDDPDEFLEEKLRAMEHGYSRDVWQDQPGYVECWLEKDALSGIFRPIVSSYGVPLRIGRGYDSWTAMKRAADDYHRRVDDEGKDTTILYFGDFDPSGEDMHRSLIDRLGMLDVYPDVPKIALTHEDAQRLPFDLTKGGDSRAPAFIPKYGDVAVELDALPVEELQERIRGSIEAHMDMSALEDSRRIQREERKRIRDDEVPALQELVRRRRDNRQ
jgi:hypothetical protein